MSVVFDWPYHDPSPEKMAGFADAGFVSEVNTDMALAVPIHKEGNTEESSPAQVELGRFTIQIRDYDSKSHFLMNH